MKKLWIVIFLCLWPSCVFFAQVKNQAREEVRTSGALASIPFEESGSSVFLHVSVNDSKPLWFILDSGANSCIVDETRAKELRLVAQSTGQGTGAGAGTYPYQKLRKEDVSFKLKSLVFRCEHTIAIDLSQNYAVTGHELEGILGSDFFQQYVVEIDYDARLVRIFDPATFVYRGHGETIPLQFDKRLPHVIANLTVTGQPSQIKRLLIDSGSEDAVDDEIILKSKDRKRQGIGGVGLGQEYNVTLGTISRFRLGSITLRDVPSAAPGVALIGGEVLRRFTITFDYSRQRMYWEPNRHLRDSFEQIGPSGIDLSLAADRKNFIIHQVRKGSAADRAGLHPGDQITAIDGTSAEELGLRRAQRVFARGKGEYELQVERGSTHFEVWLDLSEIAFSQSKVYGTVQQQTVVTGTLLSSDGHAMARAHVHLSRFNKSKPLASVAVGQDGSFKLVTTETGLLVVRFTGVDHQSRQITLLVDKPMKIDLNVRLKTYDYRDDFGEVKLIGDFNDFSFKSAKVMTRRSDGTYFAEFDTAADRFAYQLLGLRKSGGTINGTQSEDYVYDGGGDYRSVVMPKGGHVTVTFDPRALVRSEADGSVRFKDITSSAARFVSIYDAMMGRRDQLHDALVEYKKTGRPLSEFTYDWSADLTDLAQKISKEKRPMLRQALLFSYLDIGYGTYGAKLDASLAREALAKIAPNSPLWSIEPTLIGVAIDSIGEPHAYTAYVQEVIDHNSDPAVVKFVRASLSADRQIVAGKTIPAFSLAAFDSPGTMYTSESLKGKIVLIDFWATWCVPCIEEMPNLHQEHEKFKGQGFEILSVSLDEKPELVSEFRKEKWKMPWLHSLLTSNPDVKKQFEIVGIPRGILIGRDGHIIATDKALRGRNLDQALSQAVSAP